MAARDEGRLHLTAALALAALVLYVPANIYPILHMSAYGAYSESTVWDGARGLLENNEWFVGIVVLVASIIVPPQPQNAENAIGVEPAGASGKRVRAIVDIGSSV